MNSLASVWTCMHCFSHAPSRTLKAMVKEAKAMGKAPEPHGALLTRHGNKTLCLRFNKDRCADKRCKFAHLCAVRLPNG